MVGQVERGFTRLLGGLKEPNSKLRSALLLLCLVLLFVGLRALALTADPPAKLPYDVNTRELFAEGAAKAHEARNYALFGQWQTHPVDNYQFWRPQAPVWVYSLAAFFELCGVSIASFRAHSILVAAAGFLVCLFYGRKQLSNVGLVAVGLFLGCNYFYIHYTRVGLVEPMVVLFVAATVLSCQRLLDDLRWLTPACACLLLAVFSKMSGLVIMPLFLLCAFVAWRRSSSLSLRQKLYLAAPAALMLLGAAVYMTSDAYVRRAIWTVAHMAYAQDGQTEVDTSKLEPLAVLTNYLSGERWSERFFVLFPVAAVFCIPAVIHALVQFWQTRRLAWDQLTLLWLLLVHGSLQLSPLTDLRFYVALFAPVALLGARGLELSMAWLRRWPVTAPALAVVALGVACAIDLPRQKTWFETRKYEVLSANRRVSELIGPRQDAVVVGLWAPWLTLETPYKFYIVRNYFNVSKESLAQLGVTHLLLAPGDRSGKFVNRSFPRQFRSKRALASFKVYTQRITLYELTEALGR